jgi:DNA primase
MSLLKIFARYHVETMSNGQLKSMCPFRENHTGGGTGQGLESFRISPDINAYHCFSCKAKGNLIKLLTSDKFDVPFFEALEYVRLTEYKKEVKDSINGADAEYYIDFNKPPKEFLNRGFSKELLRYFRVGMTDQPHTAGIPHYSYENELLGIKFRNLKEKDFWYSPGYIKENNLYNFNPKAPYMIVTEGETDTWRAHSWGYFICASMGTSLSEAQAEMLSVIPKVYLGYNTDLPGVRCTNQAYQLLHKYTDVEILNLPANDIDECSFRQFKASFNNPVHYGTFKLMTGI